MLHLLVDTCVWLNLAKDHQAKPLVAALEALIGSKDVRLIVPQLVFDEFRRNKARVVSEGGRSLQSHFRLVIETVGRLGDEADRDTALKTLREVDHKVAMGPNTASDLADRVENLLTIRKPLTVPMAVKNRAAERALSKKAPFHQNKNSMGDTVLIEMYADAMKKQIARNDRLAFVTENYRDFSQVNGDRRVPHPDIADLFSKHKSTYWLSLSDALKLVDPNILDIDFDYSFQSRRLSEIVEAESVLMRQVWYNRHMVRRELIEEGKIHVVPESQYSRSPYRPDQILDTIWAGALEAAKKTEEEIGIDNLGPWDDFEWGMVNGKLSAVRWVLGDDWDMLDSQLASFSSV
jgi:PIN domain